MAPLTNRVKVIRWILGLIIEISNFAFKVKIILGLESTRSDGYGAIIGLFGPHY